MDDSDKNKRARKIYISLIRINILKNRLVGMDNNSPHLRLKSTALITKVLRENSVPYEYGIVPQIPLVEEKGDGYRLLGNINSYQFLMDNDVTSFLAILVKSKSRNSIGTVLQEIELHWKTTELERIQHKLTKSESNINRKPPSNRKRINLKRLKKELICPVCQLSGVQTPIIGSKPLPRGNDYHGFTPHQIVRCLKNKKHFSLPITRQEWQLIQKSEISTSSLLQLEEGKRCQCEGHVFRREFPFDSKDGFPMCERRFADPLTFECDTQEEKNV